MFGPDKEPELSISLPRSGQRPMNLSFVTTPAIAGKVKDKAVLPDTARAGSPSGSRTASPARPYSRS